MVRKFLFLGPLAKEEHLAFLASLAKKNPDEKISCVYFDEMESFEKSKCLPVSIPLVVNPENRKILNFRVCSMPAKGPLASLSRRKYGERKDERASAIYELWNELKNCIAPNPEIVTDENPQYPGWLRACFPQFSHKTHKGRRGCVVGQGELKRGGFDPLFALNHSAAMFRANINRLVRRTWCTTKRKERLAYHIYIYINYHNQVLTA